jgi:DNA (cytosine-5)-methyltransferase 1
MGLSRTGFEVVGFDIAPQPRYPFEFHQQDALNVDLSSFDAVWASPPCQRWTRAGNGARAQGRTYPDLITPTRERFLQAGLPWVIENVLNAPVQPHVMLCGKMFGLRVYRHRLFESSVFMLAPPHEKHYDHMKKQDGKFSPKGFISVAGHSPRKDIAASVMQIDWMNHSEITQAIPPAYSEFLGLQLMNHLEAGA